MGSECCCVKRKDVVSSQNNSDIPQCVEVEKIDLKSEQFKKANNFDVQDQSSTRDFSRRTTDQELETQMIKSEEKKENNINNVSIQVQQSKTVFDQLKDLHDSGIDLHALNQQEQKKWIELIINEETQKDPQKMKTMKEAIKKRTGKKSF